MKNTIIKRSVISGLLSVALLLGCGGVAARAQTAPPAPVLGNLPVPISLDALSNLPIVTNFSAMTFGIETGVATKNGQVANFIKGDWYYRTNWMTSAEIQNAPVATVLNNAAVYFGYRKVYNNAEIYGQLGGRRTFSTASERPSFQGGALLGASWYPMTGGRFAITASVFFGTDPSKPLGNSPNTEIRAGGKIGL